MDTTNLMEYLLEETDDKPEWRIDNDRTADWAIEKVMQAISERDRLIKIADERIKELQEQKREIGEKADRNTQYLTGKLFEYFQVVKPSSITKTRRTYNLLAGKLVLKKQQPEYVRDEQEMVAWAKEHAPEYVQTRESIAWGELKKATALDGETVVMAETGEVIPGVKAFPRDDVFEVTK
jgi:hypothetical protein